MYVASSDLDGTGSTPLHLDATGAINILVYSTTQDREDVGAMWHIFAPEDSDKIRAYLRQRGTFSEDEDPIHARNTYLDVSMRAELQAFGVIPYEIRQRLGDVVLIPAGCAHQVRVLSALH